MSLPIKQKILDSPFSPPCLLGYTFSILFIKKKKPFSLNIYETILATEKNPKAALYPDSPIHILPSLLYRCLNKDRFYKKHLVGHHGCQSTLCLIAHCEFQQRMFSYMREARTTYNRTHHYNIIHSPHSEVAPLTR